jgi:putative inorganic carbon (hco3(-)) transporter
MRKGYVRIRESFKNNSMTNPSLYDRIIRYCFYTLFFLVPLVVTNNTSELFEFNKMWLTYGLTIIIVASWLLKSVILGKFTLQRTPLDIPIILFLLAHIIATMFSLDHRISIWGYYSRFNGGLLSIISYIILYYAFISNFLSRRTPSLSQSMKPAKHEQNKEPSVDIGSKTVKQFLLVSLISGTIVALWGLPSHFGKDPTCFLFRGSLDVSCWTESFQPTVRIFSTIGQPAWLAAYLSILLPIALAYFLKFRFEKKFVLYGSLSLLLLILYYVDLIYANTRAGFLGFWAGNIVFWGVLLMRNILPKATTLKYFLITNCIFLAITFFLGTPLPQVNPYTFPALSQKVTTNESVPTQAPSPTQAPTQSLGEFAGTDSGTIRLYVWQGAIDAWKANPIFGTGVETFAFAYYKHRPLGHNMTSEWDYLYNKAHNEYLNYLTTTGIFGLGSYLALIALFLFLTIKYLLRNSSNELQQHELHSNGTPLQSAETNFNKLLSVALIASFVSILVSNFFGFSVVIVNVYFFLIPAFVLVLLNLIAPDRTLIFPYTTPAAHGFTVKPLSLYSQSLVVGIALFALYFLYLLMNFWRADVAYAYGYNLDRINEYQAAYPYLEKAVNLRSTEPLFRDELALNNATLALAFFQAKDTNSAAQLADRAINISNAVVTENPNNIVYWKNRVRIFYNLAQIDPKYFGQSLEAMQKAQLLAPTDAKVLYNLAVLHGQMGDTQKGLQMLDEVLRLKPNYSDAYFAKGLFYHSLAIDENENVINADMQQKAVESMQYILDHINRDDKRAIDSLQSWGVR